MATCFYPISQETKQQVEELKKTVQLFAPLLPYKTSELINNIIGAWQEKNNKEGFLPTKKELVEYLFKNVYKESPVKEELLDEALKTSLEMVEIQEKAIEDGTYLKAPNGNKSNLNERQWLQVRTKAFKKWFGDWEKSFINKKLHEANIIWGHPGIGKTKFFNDDNTEVIDFDTVYKSRINKELGLPENAEARKAWRREHKEEYKQKIFDLFDEAVRDAKAQNKKLLVSDMQILEEREYMLDIITQMSEQTFANRSNQRNEPYDEGRKLWKQDIDNAINKVKDKNKVIHTGDYYLTELYATKENASKVIDENGEPLVVYHGGENNINIFQTYHKDEDVGDMYGAYFTKDKKYAETYEKGKIYSVFLNIKNPLFTEGSWTGVINDDSIFKQYDGIINDKFDNGILQKLHLQKSRSEIIVKNSNQIKSATDNIGTFLSENTTKEPRSLTNDIRFATDKTASKPQVLNEDKLKSIGLQSGQVYTVEDIVNASDLQKAPVSKAFLKRMLASAQKAGIKYIFQQSTNPGEYGKAQGDTVILHIDPSNPKFTHVLLHETIHSFLTYAINNPSQLSAEQQKAIEELREIFNYVRQQDIDNIFGAASDIHEFVAELANPNVYATLQKSFLPYKSQNLITRIINKILQLLGLRKSVAKRMEEIISGFLISPNFSDTEVKYAKEQAAAKEDVFRLEEETFASGTSYKGIDIGGDTIEEAFKKITKAIDNNTGQFKTERLTTKSGDIELGDTKDGLVIPIDMVDITNVKNPDLITGFRAKSIKFKKGKWEVVGQIVYEEGHNITGSSNSTFSLKLGEGTKTKEDILNIIKGERKKYYAQALWKFWARGNFTKMEILRLRSGGRLTADMIENEIIRNALNEIFDKGDGDIKTPIEKDFKGKLVVVNEHFNPETIADNKTVFTYKQLLAKVRKTTTSNITSEGEITNEEKKQIAENIKGILQDKGTVLLTKEQQEKLGNPQKAKTEDISEQVSPIITLLGEKNANFNIAAATLNKHESLAFVMARYLSNFGIEVRDLEKEGFTIDYAAYVLNAKDERALLEGGGAFIAFLMKDDPDVKTIIEELHNENGGNSSNLTDYIDDYLQTLGKAIADELVAQFNEIKSTGKVLENERPQFLEGLKNIIRKFLKINTQQDRLIEDLGRTTKRLVNYIVNNDLGLGSSAYKNYQEFATDINNRIKNRTNDGKTTLFSNYNLGGEKIGKPLTVTSVATTSYKECEIANIREADLTLELGDTQESITSTFRAKAGEQKCISSLIDIFEAVSPENVDAEKIDRQATQLAKDIVKRHKNKKTVTLNIAGTDIVRSDYTQEDYDYTLYLLLNSLQEKLAEKGYTIGTILNSGQTGIEEAAIKAGLQLNIPVKINTTINYSFRLDGEMANEYKDEFEKSSDTDTDQKEESNQPVRGSYVESEEKGYVKFSSKDLFLKRFQINEGYLQELSVFDTISLKTFLAGRPLFYNGKQYTLHSVKSDEIGNGMSMVVWVDKRNPNNPVSLPMQKVLSKVALTKSFEGGSLFSHNIALENLYPEVWENPKKPGLQKQIRQQERILYYLNSKGISAVAQNTIIESIAAHIVTETIVEVNNLIETLETLDGIMKNPKGNEKENDVIQSHYKYIQGNIKNLVSNLIEGKISPYEMANTEEYQSIKTRLEFLQNDDNIKNKELKKFQLPEINRAQIGKELLELTANLEQLSGTLFDKIDPDFQQSIEKWFAFLNELPTKSEQEEELTKKDVMHYLLTEAINFINKRQGIHSLVDAIEEEQEAQRIEADLANEAQEEQKEEDNPNDLSDMEDEDMSKEMGKAINYVDRLTESSLGKLGEQMKRLFLQYCNVYEKEKDAISGERDLRYTITGSPELMDVEALHTLLLRELQDCATYEEMIENLQDANRLDRYPILQDVYELLEGDAIQASDSIRNRIRNAFFKQYCLEKIEIMKSGTKQGRIPALYSLGLQGGASVFFDVLHSSFSPDKSKVLNEKTSIYDAQGKLKYTKEKIGASYRVTLGDSETWKALEYLEQRLYKASDTADFFNTNSNKIGNLCVEILQGIGIDVEQIPELQAALYSPDVLSSKTSNGLFASQLIKTLLKFSKIPDYIKANGISVKDLNSVETNSMDDLLKLETSKEEEAKKIVEGGTKEEEVIIKQINNAVQQASEVSSDESLEEYKMLSYSLETIFNKEYIALSKLLSDLIPANTEDSMKYVGKTYYAYQEPSHVGMLLKKLNRLNGAVERDGVSREQAKEKLQKYMDSLFGNDPLYSITTDGKKTWFNPLMQALYDGKFIGKGNITKQTVKFSGYKEVSKWKPADYRQAALACFNVGSMDKDTQRAYLLPVISDKAVLEAISLPINMESLLGLHDGSNSYMRSSNKESITNLVVQLAKKLIDGEFNRINSLTNHLSEVDRKNLDPVYAERGQKFVYFSWLNSIKIEQNGKELTFFEAWEQALGMDSQRTLLIEKCILPKFSQNLKESKKKYLIELYKYNQLTPEMLSMIGYDFFEEELGKLNLSEDVSETKKLEALAKALINQHQEETGENIKINPNTGLEKPIKAKAAYEGPVKADITPTTYDLFFTFDYFMQAFMEQLFVGDPADYKNYVMYTKRMNQIHSNTQRNRHTFLENKNKTVELTHKGQTFTKKVPAGHEAVVTFKDPMVKTDTTLAEKILDESPLTQNLKDDIMKLWGEEITSTDGQAFRSIESYKKIAELYGFNSVELEVALDHIKNGIADIRDFSVAITAFKPFFVGMEKTVVELEGGGTFEHVGFKQHKNSEAAIFLHSLFKSAMDKSPAFQALQQFMSETGVDVVLFSSNVKVGASGAAIFPDQDTYTSKEDILEKLKEAVINTPSALSVRNMENYGIASATSDDFVDKKRPRGTQVVRLMPSDLPGVKEETTSRIKEDGSYEPNSYDILLEHWQHIVISDSIKDKNGNTLFIATSITEEGEDGEEKTKTTYNINKDFKFWAGKNSRRFLNHLQKYDNELWKEYGENPAALFENNPTYLLDWFIYGYLLDSKDKEIAYSTYKIIKKEDDEGNIKKVQKEEIHNQIFDFEYVEYEVEGRTYNAWELKQMYWGLLSANVRESMQELQNRFKDIETLQEYIFSILDKSNRYRQELKQAFQIITLRKPDGTTKKVFKFGFSDPSLALDLEPFLFSLLKENVIAQTTTGGDLIQTAAIGLKSLQMRYYATYTDEKGKNRKHIILTKEQFYEAENFKGWEQKATSEEEREATRVIALKQKWENEGIEEIEEGGLYQRYLNSVKNLSVAHLECYMPVSMKALLGTALVKNGDTWELDVTDVPKDLLEAIGYRVPTEGKYSMAVLKIKGFLPPGSSAIMLPHEWLLLSGSDFDIDKLYLILKESTKALQPLSNIYKSSVKITSKNTIRQLWRKDAPDSFDALPEEEKADFKKFVEKTAKEQLQKLKHTNLTKYHRLHNLVYTFVCEKYDDSKNVEQNSTQARNNRIFEIQKSMWQHQASAPNIVTPGTSKKIEEVGNDVMLLENWNTALPLIKAYSFYKSLSDDEKKNRLYVITRLKEEGKYQEVLKVLTEEGDFLSIEARMKAFQDNRDGAELVAPYAVHNANIPIFQGYDGFKFTSVKFDGIPYSSVGKICSPNGDYISRVFAAYIQAAVDNGKNPILSKLKQNSDVAYLVAYMGRVGIPVDTTAYFLANPVVQHVFEQMVLQNINMGQAIKRTLQELEYLKIDGEEEGEEGEIVKCQSSYNMFFKGIPKTYLANQIGLSYKEATEVTKTKKEEYIRPALNILDTLRTIHENGTVLSEQVRETRTDVKKNVGASISQYYSKGTKVMNEKIHWGSSNAAYLRTLRDVIYVDFPNLMSEYHPLFSVEKQELLNSLISKYPKVLHKEWFDCLNVYKMMKTELLGSLERDTWYDIPLLSEGKLKMPQHFNSLNGKITWFAYSFSKEFKSIVRALEDTGIFSMLNNVGISGSIQDHFLQKCKAQDNRVFPPTAKHLTEVQKKVFRDQVTSMLRGEMVTAEQVRKAQELKGMTPTEENVLILTEKINRSAQSLMKMVYMYSIYTTGYNGNSQASFLTFMDPDALSFLGQEYINAIHSELTEEEMHNFDRQFRLNSLKRKKGAVSIREELQEPFIQLLKKAQETPVNNKTLMVSKEELGEEFSIIELLMKGSLNKVMSFYDKSLGARVFVDILVDHAKNPSEAYILFFNSKGDYAKYLEYDPNTTVELYKNVSYFAELDAFSTFPKMVLGNIAEQSQGINIMTAEVVYTKKGQIKLHIIEKNPTDLEEIKRQEYILDIEEIKKEQDLCQ